MKPFINILIRTSNRPKSLSRCLKSIKRQDYPSDRLRVIISADNEGSYIYASAYRHEVIRVKRSPDKLLTGFYNLYLNDLISKVNEGWFFILDDDDMIAEGALNKLAEFIEAAEVAERELLIVRMAWPNGRLIPEDDYFNKPPVRKHIGMPCLIFKSTIKEQLKFDGMKAADFRMAQKLWGRVKLAMADMILVEVGNTGNGGKAIDL